MTDEKSRETFERLQARVEALKKAPPLEKARTFLKDYCAATTGLPEIQEQIRYALGFNAIPLWTGLEGLEAVLGDKTIAPGTLVSLVRQDAKQQEVPPTPEAAREFLRTVVDILRQNLPAVDEGEGAVHFGLDEVFTLPDAKGKVQRLRCIDMLRVGKENFAICVPEHASDEAGPFTVYRYETKSDHQGMDYELVTEPKLLTQVLQTHRTTS